MLRSILVTVALTTGVCCPPETVVVIPEEIYEPIDSILCVGEHIVIGTVGTGQVCYGGAICTIDASSGEVVQYRLGFTGDRSPMIIMPRVVGEFDGQLILNAVIAGSTNGERSRVLLFDTADGSTEVISPLIPAAQQYIRGVRWFPDQQVLLAERCVLPKSDMPSPLEAGAQPMCVVAPSWKTIEMETLPEVERWYDAYRALKIKWCDRWTVTDSRDTERIVGLPIVDQWPTPSLFVLNDNIVLVTERETGTYLVDVGSGCVEHISPHFLASFDYEARQGVLVEYSRDGKHQRTLRFGSLRASVREAMQRP